MQSQHPHLNHIHCRKIWREGGNVCITAACGNYCTVAARNSHVCMGIQFRCSKRSIRSHWGAPNPCSQHQMHTRWQIDALSPSASGITWRGLRGPQAFLSFDLRIPVSFIIATLARSTITSGATAATPVIAPMVIALGSFAHWNGGAPVDVAWMAAMLVAWSLFDKLPSQKSCSSTFY